ncbi:MAG: hypothetical protein Kow00117_00510 [Phototrophicales bacterium]
MITIISDKNHQIVKNMMDWLGEEFTFHCVPHHLTSKDNLQTAITQYPYQLLYVVGVHHQLSKWTLDLYYNKKIPQTPLAIAPHGDLNKWQLTVFFNRFLGKYRDVIWLAENDAEFEAILSVFPKALHHIKMMPPLGIKTPPPRPHPRSKPGNNPLRIAFEADINKHSNLHHALITLNNVMGDVIFDIYGKKQEMSYWRKCQKIIDTMPTNIQVTYHGETANLVETLASYHLFYLPTTDMYRIWQALYAGCLVLTTYQSNWLNIEHLNIGWLLSPDEYDFAASVIQEMMEMPDLLFYHLSETAQQFAQRTNINPEALEINRKLLENLIKHDPNNR